MAITSEQKPSHVERWKVKAGVAVGVYSTQQEAQLTMEDCERDDFMLRTARSLVNAAVEAQMRLHNIDRRKAHGCLY
jgi:hypothetical protein